MKISFAYHLYFKMKYIGISFLMLFHFYGGQTQTLSWVQSIGGPGPDEGIAITVDASGNIYTTGFFSDSIVMNPLNGSFGLKVSGISDMYITKSDAFGNLIWVKSIGGFEHIVGKSIVVDENENVYLTGFFLGEVDFDPGNGVYSLSNPGAFISAFICKLDQNGHFVWANKLEGYHWDEGYDIKLDSEGNVYTTGFFGGTVDFDPGPAVHFITAHGNFNGFISKLDKDGHFLWAKSLSNESIIGITDLAIDDSGNLYLTGEFDKTADFDPGPDVYNLTSNNIRDIFLCKLDDQGDFVWAYNVGGSGQDSGGAIAFNNGHIYITGAFRDTVDFDPGPGISSLISLDAYNCYISKYDTDGNFKWVKSISEADASYGGSLVVDHMNNIYVTGSFTGVANFNMGFGGPKLPSAGKQDVFISKYDPDGNVLWAGTMGGLEVDLANAIECDQSGDVYTTGKFQGACDFDPGSGTYTLTSAGNSDIFIHKMSGSTVDIDQVEEGMFSLIAYPNPSSGLIIIESDSIHNLVVYNPLGQVVFQKNINSGIRSIELGNLENGIYFLKSEDVSGQYLTQRLIIAK